MSIAVALRPVDTRQNVPVNHMQRFVNSNSPTPNKEYLAGSLSSIEDFDYYSTEISSERGIQPSADSYEDQDFERQIPTYEAGQNSAYQNSLFVQARSASSNHLQDRHSPHFSSHGASSSVGHRELGKSSFGNPTHPNRASVTLGHARKVTKGHLTGRQRQLMNNGLSDGRRGQQGLVRLLSSTNRYATNAPSERYRARQNNIAMLENEYDTESNGSNLELISEGEKYQLRDPNPRYRPAPSRKQGVNDQSLESLDHANYNREVMNRQDVNSQTEHRNREEYTRQAARVSNERQNYGAHHGNYNSELRSSVTHHELASPSYRTKENKEYDDKAVNGPVQNKYAHSRLPQQDFTGYVTQRVNENIELYRDTQEYDPTILLENEHNRFESSHDNFATPPLTESKLYREQTLSLNKNFHGNTQFSHDASNSRVNYDAALNSHDEFGRQKSFNIDVNSRNIQIHRNQQNKFGGQENSQEAHINLDTNFNHLNTEVDRFNECGSEELYLENGKCVQRNITKSIYVYQHPDADRHETTSNHKSALNYNLVFIKAPTLKSGSQEQKKTIIYLLNKEPSIDSRNIQKQDEHEVYFVNYGDGRKVTLPDGTNLEEILSTASMTNENQVNFATASFDDFDRQASAEAGRYS